MLTNVCPVECLVEIEAGLVAFCHIDPILGAGGCFVNRDARRRHIAVQHTGARCETFEHTYVGVGAFVHACDAGQRSQGRGDRIAPMLGTGAE